MNNNTGYFVRAVMLLAVIMIFGLEGCIAKSHSQYPLNVGNIEIEYDAAATDLNNSLFLIDLDNGLYKPLNINPKSTSEYKWSPDGKWFIVPDNNWNLRIYTKKGELYDQLPTLAKNSVGASFSPNSKLIAFWILKQSKDRSKSSSAADGDGLHIYDIEKKKEFVIKDTKQFNCNVQIIWRPNSEEILAQASTCVFKAEYDVDLESKYIKYNISNQSSEVIPKKLIELIYSPSGLDAAVGNPYFTGLFLTNYNNLDKKIEIKTGAFKLEHGGGKIPELEFIKIHWSRDNKLLYVIDGFPVELVGIDIASGKNSIYIGTNISSRYVWSRDDSSLIFRNGQYFNMLTKKVDTWWKGKEKDICGIKWGEEVLPSGFITCNVFSDKSPDFIGITYVSKNSPDVQIRVGNSETFLVNFRTIVLNPTWGILFPTNYTSPSWDE